MRAPSRVILLVATSLILPIDIAAAASAARQTGFDPRIVAFGEAREEIKSTPIEKRPYRPLHVYGNTVRRRHYRGDAQPQRQPRPADRR
jgi:hypothetical protein